MSKSMTSNHSDLPFRILCLDGGGAKGFYTLGVLRQIEALVGCRLSERFDLVFGTSTGAIIATLVALGHSVEDIHALYKEHVPKIMAKKTPSEKTQALKSLADTVFSDKTFDQMKTNLGIVAANWQTERPMIFKTNVKQAHGRVDTFVPGFGVRVSDAVQASCSAFPFFEKKTVTTSQGDDIVLIDGGYCANNPTLYAIADATNGLGQSLASLRVVSVGVGVYPTPSRSMFSKMYWAKFILSVQLLQKTLEINTQSMDQLRKILFQTVQTVRVNDTFERPEMATDLFEHDPTKLNQLRQRGAESYATYEATLRTFLV
jgi:uncharacterized protein